MAVKLVLLINTVLQGKQAFSQTTGGLGAITKAAGIATIALGALGAFVSGAFLTDAIQKLAEFSDEMQAVRAATEATDEQFKSLREEALRIGREFGKFTPTDAARGMRILAFAGFEVEETLQAIDPVMKLSQAGMIQLEEAANSVAGSLRSFGLDVSETSRVVDVMTKTFISSNTTVQELADAIRFVGPVAAAAGIEIEELNATFGILANSAIKGGQAGSRVRNILIRLQAPAGSAAKKIAELGIELFQLNSIADQAQKQIRIDTLRLRQLELQLDSTKDATRKLSLALDKLNLQESENLLEIAKLRDKAADENRELTDQELERIKELEDANRDLGISQDELGIQQDKLRIKEKAFAIEIDNTEESVEKSTEVLKANEGQLKSIVEIAKEFDVALKDLTQAQQTEALATIFGLRNIAAFQVIMRGAGEDADDMATSIDVFTKALFDAGGTADKVNVIVEEGLGNQIAQLKSAFTGLQIEIATIFAPVLMDLMEFVKTELMPVFATGLLPIIQKIVAFLPTVAAAAKPFIDSIIRIASESNIMNKIISIVIKIFDTLSPVLDSNVRIIDSLVKSFELFLPVIEELVPIFEINVIVGEQFADLLEHLPDLVKAIVPALIAIIKFLVTLLTTVFENTEIMDSLIDIFVSLIPVVEALSEVVVAFIPILEAWLPVLVALLPLIELSAIQLAFWVDLLSILLIPLLLLFAGTLVSLQEPIEILGKGIAAALKPLQEFSDELDSINDKRQTTVDTLNAISDAAANIGKKQPARAGISPLFGGILGFQGGGTVPGPIGAPVAAIVHGGEEIFPPGESRGNTFILETHDTFQNTFIIEKDMDINELDRMLTEVLVNAKRQAKKQLLSEGV